MSHNFEYIEETASLGAFIKNIRKSQKLTQDEIAGLSGTGLRFIVDLEKGKPTCQIKKVLDVVKVLGIKIKLESE